MVTGAASGIGKAIVRLFHDEDAIVIITDINDDAGLELSRELSERAEYLHLDVALENDWINVFEHLKKKYKKLDILINNAGISGYIQTQGPHDPENLDLASWRTVHAINSDGVALGCKYAIQLMKINHSGSIVNISSRSGLVGIPQMVHYAASKAAVRNHTKSVALYCAEKGYNIRCNSIILVPF